MSQYRDDLRAARMRLEQLEGRLSDRETELAFRELELEEMRSQLEAIRERGGEVPPRRRLPRTTRGHGFVLAPVLVGSAALCVFAVTPRPVSHAEMPGPYLVSGAMAGPHDTLVDPLSTVEASRALDRAAQAVKGCHRDGMPEWGSVRLTFVPDGSVAEAEVSGPAAGTPVGECVEQVVRAVAVPAFSGAPRTTSVPFRTK